MEIKIREDKKIVEIWSSKAERDGPEMGDTLRKICAEYGPRRSGEDDLLELTSALLLTNRRKLAERETESERMAGSSMTMGM